MKDIRTWLILILLLTVIFGWLHYANKSDKIEVSSLNYKIKTSVKGSQDTIDYLEKQKKKIILKLRIDSVKHRNEKQAYEKRIFTLEKKLAATHYTGNPSTVPDDSVKLAMDYLSQKPLNDSISKVKDEHIEDLNAHITDLQADYTKILDDVQLELNQKDKIIEDWKTHAGRLEGENKNVRRKGIWNGIKIGGAALVIGFIIGVIR